MASSTSAVEAVPAARGQWRWDDSERGIVLTSDEELPGDPSSSMSRTAVSSAAPGGLLAGLDITFQDMVKSLDQMRFKRHWQRRVEPGDIDVVILSDIKDVVLFTVQPRLPADVIRLFHTKAVDRFLRSLILYLFYYIQTWEWLTFSTLNSTCKIAEPILTPRQVQQQQNLGTLRALLARDYHTLLLGDGNAHKYHHMSNGVKSWTQRDARLWELLLRLAVRVSWVALERRYLNLIDAEVGRLFRSDAFNLAARRLQGTSRARRRPQRNLRDLILHGPAAAPQAMLFSRSPATLQLLGDAELGGQPRAPWTLLAMGRMPQPRIPESLRRLEEAYCLGEEELVRGQGMGIGILGMQRAALDVMLNVKEKQRRHEAVLSTGSTAANTYLSLLPMAKEDLELDEADQHLPDSFPMINLPTEKKRCRRRQKVREVENLPERQETEFE